MFQFQEQMDIKDRLLFQHSAFAKPTLFMEMRGTLLSLQPDVLNNRAMGSSVNGCTGGGRMRATLKFKVKHPGLHVNLNPLDPSHVEVQTNAKYKQKSLITFQKNMRKPPNQAGWVYF